jgi:hypothetical protein
MAADECRDVSATTRSTLISVCNQNEAMYHSAGVGMSLLFECYGEGKVRLRGGKL